MSQIILKKMITMKNNRLLVVLSLLLFIAATSTNIYAQNEKRKARITVSFIHIDENAFIKVIGKYKEERRYKPAGDLLLKVFNHTENDSLKYLGSLLLNSNGEGKLNITPLLKLNPKKEYTFEVTEEGSELYKNVDETLTVRIANLKAEIKTIDSVQTIVATLTDPEDNPIIDTELKVNLQRLFAPLPIGQGPYLTDETGTVIVPIKNKMPGLDGKLNYEVVLDGDDTYGTIKSILVTNDGAKITDLSTFDQRTMWSPPTKAPWVDLIVPNILIFGVWSILVILIINLFRISKNNNLEL